MGRPLRVAVVGSGPSGFYAAEALFKSDLPAQVAMVERLPTPYGLVRGGVAPDHAKIKSVTRVYDKIASHEAFEFLGNVTVGKDVSIVELQRHYDAVIFACGAESEQSLGIPGEELPGSHSATEFVGWYNGHPDHRDRCFDLSCERAVVIGQGNVAIDVARMLAKTADELRHTDIAHHALEVLADSKIKEIHLIGRRGPVQAKFTAAELKELGELVDCDPLVDPGEIVLDPASRAELEDASNQHSKRNMAILEEFAGRPAPTKSKSCRIRFFRSPVALESADVAPGRLARVVLEKNVLEGEPFRLKARGAGELEELPCGILFRSVGARGVAIPGVPFDDRRGIFPNKEGRICDGHTPVPGLYAVGWIKRGPTGIIGANKPDSQDTIKAFLADLPNLAPCPEPDTGPLKELLASRGVRVVSYADWQRIDAAEVERGKERGKPREKFVSIEEMLAVLR